MVSTSFWSKAKNMFLLTSATVAIIECIAAAFVGNFSNADTTLDLNKILATTLVGDGVFFPEFMVDFSTAIKCSYSIKTDRRIIPKNAEHPPNSIRNTLWGYWLFLICTTSITSI